MKDKLSQLHQSFLSIGLESAAQQIQSVARLYKQSSDDFSTEVNVLSSLVNTLQELTALKLHDVYPGDGTLPAYAIATHSERIVKNAESLQGYTKKDILAGMNRYLHGFIKNFMQHKLSRTSYEHQIKYEQIISMIEPVLQELQAANRSVSKGSVETLFYKVLRTYNNIVYFLGVLHREIPKMQDKEWTGPIGSSVSRGLVNIQGSTWSEALLNIEFNLQEELAKLDADFKATNDISTSDFNHMIKSFRPNMVTDFKKASLSTPIIVKIAQDDDEDELDLTVTESKKDSTSSSQTPEPKDSDKSDFIKIKKPLSPPSPPKNLFDRFIMDEPTNLKNVYYQIVNSLSLFTKDKTGNMKPIRPSTVYRVYSQYLLPQFTEQYMSLLNAASQIQTSMYQVQAIEQKLSQVLQRATQELSTLGGSIDANPKV